MYAEVVEVLVDGAAFELWELEADLLLLWRLLEQKSVCVEVPSRGCDVVRVGRHRIVEGGEDLAVQRTREKLDAQRVRSWVRLI